MRDRADASPQAPGRAWAWRKFTATLPVAPGVGELEVVCKAVDDSYNSQPDRMDAIYNFRGIVVNGWQRLRLPLQSPASGADRK